MQGVLATAHYLYRRFFADRCPARAASLAYTSLLTLVPLLMISVSILSWVPFFKGMGGELQQFILRNFVAASANVIAQQIEVFISQLHSLNIYNIVFLAIACVFMIYNMVGAFNDIWRVKLKRHAALSFVIYMAVLLATPLLFGMLLLITSYVASLSLIAKVQSLSYVRTTFSVILPHLTAFIVFSFFNWILPSCRVKLWAALVAGGITAVLFAIAKQIFLLYVKWVPTYRIIYGALATIPFFLIWLYVLWLIILLGALICHILVVGVPNREQKNTP